MNGMSGSAFEDQCVEKIRSGLEYSDPLSSAEKEACERGRGGGLALAGGDRRDEECGRAHAEAGTMRPRSITSERLERRPPQMHALVLDDVHARFESRG